MNSVKLQDTKVISAFLSTNNKLLEREIKNKMPLTVTAKRIQYLGINFTKYVKDLYSENYKILRKEIEDDTSKWKDIPWS